MPNQASLNRQINQLDIGLARQEVPTPLYRSTKVFLATLDPPPLPILGLLQMDRHGILRPSIPCLLHVLFLMLCSPTIQCNSNIPPCTRQQVIPVRPILHVCKEVWKRPLSPWFVSLYGGRGLDLLDRCVSVSAPWK